MLHSEYLSRIVSDRYKHFRISRYSPSWRLWHILMSQNNMQTVLNRPIVSSAGSIIILINEPSASVVTSYEIKTNNCSQSRTQTNDSFSFLHVNELRHTDVFSGASSDFCVFVLLDLVSRIRLINRVWCRFLCHLDDFWASLSCFLSFDGRAGARCSEAV